MPEIEGEPQYTLTYQVMQKLRDFSKMNRDFETATTRQAQAEEMEKVALDSAIGKFVVRNYEAAAEIANLPFAPGLKETADKWLAAKMHGKMLNVLKGLQVHRRHKELVQLLEGRTITAIVVKDFFYAQSYNDRATDSKNMTAITARFKDLDLSEDCIWLGNDELTHKISIRDILANTTAIEVE